MLCHSTMHNSLLRQGLNGFFRSKGGGVWVRGKNPHWSSLSLVSEDRPCCLCSRTGSQFRRLSSPRDSQGARGEVSFKVGVKQKAPMKLVATQAEGRPYQTTENGEGGIHLIVGPMFAGKSTALLRRVQDEASRGRRVALVKSDKDVRYGLSAIVTHDGLQMPCFAVPDLATFKSKVGEEDYSELEVIGIDEAQFFPDLYEFCQTAADFNGKKIIVAGLDGDFLRRKFGSTLDLVPVADSVVKLCSQCEICGRPAIFSFRKSPDTNTELVGGSDVYMPVCRQHFVNGQMAVEAASSVINAHQMVQF